MTPRPLHHPLLEGCGIEHGFGVRGVPEPAGLRRPRQVHGARVVRASECGGPVAPEADAVVSTGAGVAVGVVTADCVPVLAAGRDGRVVAAIHAGWRGLAQGVIEAGVGALREAGADRPVAVIGPCIGSCCYEVDEPVLSALRRCYPAALDEALRPARPGHWWLDLAAVARQALRGAGLERDAIGHLEGCCTSCDPKRFHSFRRDGARAGRLLHFVRSASERVPESLDTASGES